MVKLAGISTSIAKPTEIDSYEMVISLLLSRLVQKSIIGLNIDWGRGLCYLQYK